MARVGVISDTHISSPRRAIPAPVLQAFQYVDYILHAGDVIIPSVLEELELLAPVYAVAGNVDPPNLAFELGDRRLLDLEGMRIGLTPGHPGAGRTTSERARNAFAGTRGLRVIVFGHSHEPYGRGLVVQSRLADRAAAPAAPIVWPARDRRRRRARPDRVPLRYGP